MNPLEQTGEVLHVNAEQRCGFVREGFARRYLCINGVWQDHYLYARLVDDPRH